MHVLLGNGPWMAWNSVLALASLACAVFLFTGPMRTRGGPVWWLGAAVFLAFLPNGPYVLTDLVHLPRDARALRAHEVAAVGLVLEYSLLMLIGVAAYAGSLSLLRRYLLDRGWTRRNTVAVEIAIHALCAVGVLLGRVNRFNSWDIVTRPVDVAGHLLSRIDHSESWLLLITMFVIIATTTLVARALALGFVAITRGLSGRA